MKTTTKRRYRRIQDILCLIMENPEISQVELAKKTKLTKQRISVITKELIGRGVIEYKHMYIVKRLDRVE